MAISMVFHFKDGGSNFIVIPLCMLSLATSATLEFSCHHLVWNPKQTVNDKLEEGEDDVKSACPLRLGQHTCYNGRDKGSRPNTLTKMNLLPGLGLWV